MPPHEPADVAIIGAGVSGLCAARRLVERGLSVRVLEARDRVGGRTLSTELAGDWIDLGGQWFGPTQESAYALARELGLETFPQYDRGRKLIDHGGRLKSYAGLVPNIPVLQRVALGIGIAGLERRARMVSRKQPESGRSAREWDGQTVEDWLRRHVRGDAARAIVRIATQMIFAAEPRDLSFLYFLHYLRTGGGLLRAMSLRGGAQQDRVVGGMQQLSLRLAGELGDRVTLNAPVHRLEQTGEAVRIHTRDAIHEASHIIVAMAPRLCERIEFDPPLPEARRELQQAMPMGRVIKCVVAYDRPFWREAGLSGEVVSDGDLLRAVFDDSSHDSQHAALVAFIVGDAAAAADDLSAGERERAVVAELTRFFGDAAAHPAAYVDRSWLAEEWSEGCYAGVMGPGVLTTVGSALRQRFDRVHFAGTETATRWAGYIDGAIQSGRRAANEVLAELAPER